MATLDMRKSVGTWIVTATVNEDVPGMGYRAYAMGQFRSACEAFLLAGRMMACADVRSVNVWSVSGRLTLRMVHATCVRDCAIDWESQQGEWESNEAHEIEARRLATTTEDFPRLSATAFVFGVRRLSCEDVAELGLDLPTNASNVNAVVIGRSSEQPGEPRA